MYVCPLWVYDWTTCRSWCNRAWWPYWGQGLGGQKSTPEQVQRYGRRLITQRNDERQYNGDRRRLALSNTQAIYFTHWLVNRIGGWQHAVVLTALWTLLFRFHRPRFELRHFELTTCLAWGTRCTCVYLVKMYSGTEPVIKFPQKDGIWLGIWTPAKFYEFWCMVTLFKSLLNTLGEL